MIIRKCKGCGSTLQNKDPLLPGFAPKLDAESTFCKRCFRMKHYNELPKIVATNEDYEKVIDEVLKRKALMVFIVDIFAFKTTFHPKMIQKLRGRDVILVANKFDLLPRSVNPQKVIDWISKECQKSFFKVEAIGIASAKKGYYMDELIHVIDQARVERDVYFVGCANVGKSSIINALLKKTTSITDDLIATSMIPGTTLNEIRIPFFEDNRAFIDTPGLINEADILNKLLPSSYGKIVPKNELKPITYQITDQNAIFLGGLACLQFTCEKTVSVTVYVSNNLYIHRAKQERVEALLETQLGKLLTPPSLEELPSISYKEEEFDFKSEKRDIWFSGFGFVQISGACHVKLKTISETEVYITNAIVG